MITQTEATEDTEAVKPKAKRRPYSGLKQKVLTIDEQRQIRLAIVKGYDHLRDKVLIRLAMDTGARGCELRALTRQSLNLVDQTILIVGAKGSNDREIPLHDDLFELLQLVIKVTPAHENRIFPINGQRLRKIWSDYRPNPKKGFHCLRHTFAVNLYDKTKNIVLVQKFLGHKDIKNTMVYMDLVDTAKEMKAALVHI